MNRSSNNMQMLFDKVVAHAREQKTACKGASLDHPEAKNPPCYYRGPKMTSLEGKKCFVGALISDYYYIAELENKLSNDYRVVDAVEKSLGIHLTPYEIDFLRDLQAIHDNEEESAWEGNFEFMTSKYGLNLKRVAPGA